MKLAVGMVKSSVACPMLPFVNKAPMDSTFRAATRFHNFSNCSWIVTQTSSPIPFLHNDARVQAKFSAHLELDYSNCWCWNTKALGSTKGLIYSDMANSGAHFKIWLASQWKLDFHVNGLKSVWSKNFSQTALQKIEHKVLIKMWNCCLTLKFWTSGFAMMILVTKLILVLWVDSSCPRLPWLPHQTWTHNISCPQSLGLVLQTQPHKTCCLGTHWGLVLLSPWGKVHQ